jgi:hypothetical protein
MLFAQIPAGTRKRLAAELKFDLKVVSLSLREEPNDETRYSKLGAVERYLRDNEDVGTIDAPGVWFGGELPMIAGPLDAIGSQAPVAFFSGETATMMVGLGGSITHLIGASTPPAGSYQFPSSALPTLLNVVKEQNESEQVGDSLDEQPGGGSSFFALAMLVERRQGAYQNVEFLARRLMYTPARPKSAVLGSPLYVAATD